MTAQEIVDAIVEDITSKVLAKLAGAPALQPATPADLLQTIKDEVGKLNKELEDRLDYVENDVEELKGDLPETVRQVIRDDISFEVTAR